MAEAQVLKFPNIRAEYRQCPKCGSHVDQYEAEHLIGDFKCPVCKGANISEFKAVVRKDNGETQNG